MILETIAALLLTLQSPTYEITLHSEPMPMQQSKYAAIWLNPGETVEATQYTTKDGQDWFYVHRANYESGWLQFEYGKMRVVKIMMDKRVLIAR